jgi:WD40 repeat protein
MRAPLALRGHRWPVVALAFSPEGKTLASGSADGTVTLWDVPTRRERAAPAGHADIITGLAFSPDGKTLASSSWDGTVRLWEAATGRQRAALTGSAWGVTDVAFGGDNQTLAWANVGGTVTLWDIPAARESATLRPALAPIAFSPDGKTLASETGDGAVELWDIAAGKVGALLRAERVGRVSSLGFTADGKTLVTGHPGAVQVWDVAAAKRRAVFQVAEARSTFVAVTADGRILAVWGGDRRRAGSLRLLDAASGKELSRVEDGCAPLAFSPDGKVLASGSRAAESTVLLWEVPPDKEEE